MRFFSLRSAVVAGLAVSVAGAPAHAQFGGLIKRAAERAAGKSVDKAVDDNMPVSPGCQPTFDKETVELTGDRLDKLIKGLAAQSSAGDKAGRGPLVAKRDEVEARIDDLKEDPSMARAKKNSEQWAECRMSYWAETMQKKAAGNPMAIAAMMGAGNPEQIRKSRELEERAAAAEKRGDMEKAKIIRDSSASTSMMGTGMQLHGADSVAADKKCGKEPAASKKQAELDSLQVVQRDLDDKIRTIDEDNDDILYKTSGMTRKQMAMAKERIQAFFANGGGKQTVCGFSKPEMDAIRERKDVLSKLK